MTTNIETAEQALEWLKDNNYVPKSKDIKVVHEGEEDDQIWLITNHDIVEGEVSAVITRGIYSSPLF